MKSLPMLISLIETSINEKTLDTMYSDFLEEAIKIGISSYTLNVLIENIKKANENKSTEDNDSILTPFIFRQNIIGPKIEVEERLQTQGLTFVNKKGYGYIISLVIILLFNVVLFALFCQRTSIDLLRINESLDAAETKISKAMEITDIGSAPILSFKSWASTNKEHNSESHKDYNMSIKTGDKLSFDYDVSAENYDTLNVYLINDSGTTKILSKRGIESGEKSHYFSEDGDVTIRFEYSKDYSVSKHDDGAKVANIKVYKPLKVQITEIKSILSGE